MTAAEAVNAAYYQVLFADIFYFYAPKTMQGLIDMTVSANDIIFEDAFSKLRGAYYLQDWSTTNSEGWDQWFLTNEQQIVQSPVCEKYKNTSSFSVYNYFAKQPLIMAPFIAIAGISLEPFPEDGCLSCISDRIDYGRLNMGYQNLTDAQLSEIQLSNESR